ncbi:hypothetical protein PALA111701_19860 [Paenibacillus lactis]
MERSTQGGAAEGQQQEGLVRPEVAPKRVASPEKGLVRPEEAPKRATSPEKGLLRPEEAPKRATSLEKGFVRPEEAPKRAESRQPDSARFSVHTGSSVPYLVLGVAVHSINAAQAESDCLFDFLGSILRKPCKMSSTNGKRKPTVIVYGTQMVASHCSLNGTLG